MDKQARKIMSAFNDRTVNEQNARQIAFYCVQNAGEALPVLMAFAYWLDIEANNLREYHYQWKGL